jgi:hypothetical protein
MPTLPFLSETVQSLPQLFSPVSVHLSTSFAQPSKQIARRLPDNNLHCYKSTPSPSQQVASIGPSRKGGKYLEATPTKLNSKRKHSYSFQLPSISSNRTVLHPEWLLLGWSPTKMTQRPLGPWPHALIGVSSPLTWLVGPPSHNAYKRRWGRGSRRGSPAQPPPHSKP